MLAKEKRQKKKEKGQQKKNNKKIKIKKDDHVFSFLISIYR